ncbi:IclR family transcriptional regulator domain-containing protein [Hydrogenophaga palleronii]|uniref:IclR family transcriptional regulator domain-containing protein n=1 Tax=Hydrogenophaga palleronii TaxID=65655 RepID=UPI000A68F0B8|nr:IclR family transcriptional regulator C-terminal domain-containing protein [Hydrogenophaga palleronii]
MDTETHEGVDKEYVMGLEKGLLLIEAFGVSNSPLTLSEAAEITGHSKASTRRALLTLVKLGYARASGRQFSLEPRTLRLVHAYVNSTPLTKVAQPILEITSERTRESASLAVLDSQFVVFVARSTQRRSLSFGLGIGARLPAYCSATGRVLLSGFADEEVEFRLQRMSRQALTSKTKTELAVLMQEVHAARQCGYAVSDEELELGLRSIAVPVRNGKGELLGAMSLAVATSRMSRDDLVNKLLPELEVARRTFSMQL